MRAPLTVLCLFTCLCLAPAPPVVGAAQDAAGFQPDPADFRMIKLRYANAEQIAGQMQDILAGNCVVVTDERTNQLILRASKNILEQAERLIENMDVPVERGGGNVTEMIQPRHRSVMELHKILNVHFQDKKGQYLVVDE